MLNEASAKIDASGVNSSTPSAKGYLLSSYLILVLFN